MSKVPSLSFANLNCCSIRNKTEEVLALTLGQGIDVMCVTESWLFPKESALSKEIEEFPYKLLSVPRGSRGGGVAVVYRKELKVKRCKSRRVFSSFELLEAILDGPGIDLTRFAVIYRPPDPSKQATFLEEFEEFLSVFSSKSGHHLITGDFNVHVEKLLCPFAQSFLQILEDHCWIQHVREPTHLLGGTLDLVLTKDVPLLDSLNVTPTPEVPDHFLVDFKIHCGSANRIKNTKMVVGRSMKRVSAESVRDMILKSKLCQSPLPESVDECVKLYNTILEEILDKLAPIEEKVVSESSKPPWFTQECYDALHKRRRAERKYKSAYKKALKQKQKNKPVCYEKVQMAEKLFIAEIRFAKTVFNRTRREFFQQRLEAAAGNHAAVYQILNHLLGKEKTPTQLPSTDDPDGLPDRMIDFFTSKIEAIYEKIQLDPDFTADLPELTPPLEAELPKFAKFQPVSDAMLAATVRAMNKKHCTLDPMPTSFVNDAFPALIPIVSKIVNTSLTKGEVPDSLKSAVIRPSYKNSDLDPDELNSYRPISNLSFISKVLEKCVADQLTDYVESNGLFSEVQSAYRSKHSCETATIKIINDVLVQLDKKSKVILVLLDLSAAFDTISHAKLLHRLKHDYGVTGKVLSWIESYLTNRTARVKIGSVESEAKSISIGVPQGSILGPLLFILYTRDLQKIAELYGLSLHMYADDSQLSISFVPETFDAVLKKVQSCVSHIRLWMAQNLLKLNPDKTEVLILRNKWDKSTSEAKLNIVQEETEVKEVAKNLGVMVDSELTMSQHVSRVVQSCNYQLVNMWRIASKLNKKQKTQLVNSLIHSKIDYCNALLIGLKDTDVKRLQKLQNSATRFVHGTRSRRGVTDLRKKSHFLPVRHRIEYKICLLVYKSMNNGMPGYITEMLKKRKPKPALGVDLRVDCDTTRLEEVHSQFKYEITKTKAFSIVAPRIWNRLPIYVRTAETLPMFKKALKTYMFTLAYGTV